MGALAIDPIIQHVNEFVVTPMSNNVFEIVFFFITVLTVNIYRTLTDWMLAIPRWIPVMQGNPNLEFPSCVQCKRQPIPANKLYAIYNIYVYDNWVGIENVK